MKWILMLYLSVMVLFFVNYTNNSGKVDSIVYNLYINDFKDCLKSDGYNLVVDKEKLKKYIENKGYQIVFFENDYKFKIKFNCLFNYEKEYYFYLEKNNEKE